MDIIMLISITLLVIAICAFYSIRGDIWWLRIGTGVLAAMLLFILAGMSDYSETLLLECKTDLETFDYYRLDTEKLNPEHLTLDNCWKLCTQGSAYIDSCCYIMFNGGHLHVKGSDVEVIHLPWHPYHVTPYGTYVGTEEVGFYKVSDNFVLEDMDYDIYYSVGSHETYTTFGGSFDLYKVARIQPSEL